MSRWPHAPSHEVSHPGRYILTAATYHKEKLFNTAEKLTLLEDVLLQALLEEGWKVQAWAVFPNHYHFVGLSPDTGLGLTKLTQRIHGESCRELNRLDNRVGRNVWYRSWDTRITFEKSYLARLAYAHQNAVKQGVVREASQYRWCSARWFEERASRAFRDSVLSFKTDKVNGYDDFDV